MSVKEETKIISKKFLEMIYWSYLKDLKNGNLKNGICSIKKQAVGKSVKKAKTFHQTAFDYGK